MRVVLFSITVALNLAAFSLAKGGYGSFDDMTPTSVQVTNPERCGENCLIIQGKPCDIEGMPKYAETFTVYYRPAANNRLSGRIK
jgi:hypothetical protein